MIIMQIQLANIVKMLLAIMNAKLSISTGITNCLNKRTPLVVEQVETVVAGEMEECQAYSLRQGTQD